MPENARLMLDSIDVSDLCGLHDRALLSVMVSSFARVSAVIGMNVIVARAYRPRALKGSGRS
jgi:site-specific recombinase XerC